MRLGAIRTVLALAAIEDMELESVDVSPAFLNGEIEEEVYTKVPEGFAIGDDGSPQWALRLLKSLYGLKKAGRCWSRKLHATLESLCFRRTESGHSYTHDRDDAKIFVPVCVDNLTLASNSPATLVKLRQDLASHFEIRYLGPTEFILGIKVEWDRPNRIIYLSQSAYIQSILDEHLPVPSKAMSSVATPTLENARLSLRDSPTTAEEIAKMSKSKYKEIIGKLLCVESGTRPDISHALHVLCKFLADDTWVPYGTSSVTL